MLIHYTTQTGGDGGIRTHEALLPARFRDEYLNPLGHISFLICRERNPTSSFGAICITGRGAALGVMICDDVLALHHTGLEDIVGFEPTELFNPHAFQACPLNHSGKRPGDPYGI